ncbi:hypothetical protein [Kytococcus sedentarius]|uniref:hypothetical protein n=1 Tax=Kytococcus sedentarius TaxID=1276 RepID=UPI0035BC9401
MPTVVKFVVAVALLAVVVTLMGVLNPRGQVKAFNRVTFWRKAPEPTRRELVVRSAVNALVLAGLVLFLAVMVYDVRFW